MRSCTSASWAVTRRSATGTQRQSVRGRERERGQRGGGQGTGAHVHGGTASPGLLSQITGLPVPRPSRRPGRRRPNPSSCSASSGGLCFACPGTWWRSRSSPNARARQGTGPARTRQHLRIPPTWLPRSRASAAVASPDTGRPGRTLTVASRLTPSSCRSVRQGAVASLPFRVQAQTLCALLASACGTKSPPRRCAARRTRNAAGCVSRVGTDPRSCRSPAC